MTKKKIEQLEKEIADLKFKVAVLEARPMVIAISPIPQAQPTPWGPSYPYIGSPIMPTVTCGTSHPGSQSRFNQ